MSLTLAVVFMMAKLLAFVTSERIRNVWCNRDSFPKIFQFGWSLCEFESQNKVIGVFEDSLYLVLHSPNMSDPELFELLQKFTLRTTEKSFVSSVSCEDEYPHADHRKLPVFGDFWTAFLSVLQPEVFHHEVFPTS